MSSSKPLSSARRPNLGIITRSVAGTDPPLLRVALRCSEHIEGEGDRNEDEDQFVVAAGGDKSEGIDEFLCVIGNSSISAAGQRSIIMQVS